MLTLEELQSCRINAEVAKEAYDQSEKAMADILETKKGLESRAAGLLTAYSTVSVAILGLACVLLKQGFSLQAAWPFLAVGVLYAAGAVCFALVQNGAPYGVLGSYPRQWLLRATIDGGETALVANWTYLTYYRQAKIDLGNAANTAKGLKIRLGLAIGVSAPLAFVALQGMQLAARFCPL
jgi:hypothetical protein